MPDETRENRRRWWTAVVCAGPGWVVIGGLKILAGSLLAVLALNSGLAPADAVEPIHMYVTAYGFVSEDPWIVLTAATVFVLVSQVKINVTNAYAGSLAWSNFYSRVTHYHPGRVVWLVFNILISLLLMLLGVFETLETVLAVYSIVAIAWIGAIFADLSVLKPLGISPSFIEFRRAHLHNINPVGCGSMAIASVVSITAFAGFLGPVAQAYAAGLALCTAFGSAIVLGILTGGRYYIARTDVLSQQKAGDANPRCTICAYRYEPHDMAHCPFYEGPICSLCCSLDSHCHDVCKRPADVHEAKRTRLGDGHLHRMIPPNIVQRLAKFLGVFLVLAVVTAAVFLLAYRLVELDPSFAIGDSARLLTRLYLSSLVLICVGAWWIVLSHESRELAERDLVSSLEKLKETRQELMQSERMATIGQLTATVSHELRNPLGTLFSSVSVLRRYTGNAPKQVGPELDKMRRNIWRCVRIIEELMEFSREHQFYPRPIRLDRWIASELDDWEKPDSISLDIDLDSNAVVAVDGEKFRHALVNLLQNAQQAILQQDEVGDDGQAGTVGIATRKNGNQVELRISDEGCGLVPGTDDKIFKPLFSTKAFGVGLGLPLVKRIVEGHKGTISVDSARGEGTTISIRLPLAEGKAPPSGGQRHRGPAQHGGHAP